ncbi:MAG: CHC2 zinc finger domain-containing protein, partial [Desulfurobacteriaceae bacterium]
MGSSRVSHSFVEELLSQVDIVDVISHYVPLKQVGRNFTALCPFHHERTPSFVVSPEKQIFKCFGCGVGGNAITFVEKYEGVSFYEAV